MSYIPSFILSALIFCNVSVPSGWNEATLSQGVICEIPYTEFIVSVEEQPAAKTEYDSLPGKVPALQNGGFSVQPGTSSLKLAAGSLSVSGTSGTDALTATLPARTDGGKPLAFYARWKTLALLVTTVCPWKNLSAAVSATRTGEPFFNRAIIQFKPPFLCLSPDAALYPELKETFFAGWYAIHASKDSGWFLVHPWHPAGNLFYLRNDIAVRLSFAQAKTELTATAQVSVSDIISPATAAAATALVKTKHTETALSCSIMPPLFLMPNGSYPKETFTADADFSYMAALPGKKKQNDAKMQDNAELTIKTGASFAIRQPAATGDEAQQLFSAIMSATFKKNTFLAGLSLLADTLCFENNCRDGQLSPEVKLAVDGLSLSVKAAFLPFWDNAESSKEPSWTMKAERTLSGVKASYAVEFTGNVLKKQDISISHEQGPLSLSTAITVRNDTLTWKLSYARKW